jgi:hypothetical protein
LTHFIVRSPRHSAISQPSDTPDDIADYWAEIQESLADALVEYKKTNPEFIELMEKHPYFNTMIRNVFANGWVRGNIAGVKAMGNTSK